MHCIRDAKCILVWQTGIIYGQLSMPVIYWHCSASSVGAWEHNAVTVQCTGIPAMSQG